MIDLSNKPKMTEVYPFIAESIKDGGQFVLFPRGTSMNPTLYEGKDCVVLVEIQEPRLFDIMLYRRKSGQFVLHRIMKIKNGKYTMCGDNQYLFEKGIERNQLLAVVSEVRKENGEIYGIDRIHADGKKFLRMPKKVIRRLLHPLRIVKRKLFGEKTNH